MKEVLILIPAFNEEESISLTLDKLCQERFMSFADIMVINDASKDNTKSIINSYNVLLMTNVFNLGYGSSLQLGYKYAVKHNYKYVIQLDADGQHDVENVVNIYKALKEKSCKGRKPDIVIGSRFLYGSKTFKISFIKKLSMKWFSFLIKHTTKQKITDPTSGLQGLRRNAFSYYSEFNNFDYYYPDANMIIQMLLLKYNICEIPAVMHERTAGESMHSGLIKQMIYMLIMPLSIWNTVIRLKKKIKFTPFIGQENYSVFENPYCGFYSSYRFYIEKDIRHDDKSHFRDIKFNKNRLCLLIINLKSFKDKPLTNESLENLNKILLFFAKNDKQIILRFVYDWDGKGIVSEPKDISIILLHMDQLSPLFKKHDTYIYIVQGLFIGSWGEMHSSRYLNQHHIINLSDKLYNALGKRAQIAVRTPSFIRSIFRVNKPLDSEEYEKESKRKRFGLFNDAIMASETDLGTYGDIKERETKAYCEKWLREDELKFQKQHCLYTANGGEVVGIEDLFYNESSTVVKTLRKMRVSYLHDEYDKKVLDKWKTIILDSTFMDYRGITLYDYIDIHLGYRYSLKEVSLSKVSRKQKNNTLNIKIVNTGFAPSYVKFDVKFILKEVSDKEKFEGFIDTDTREWFPMEDVNLTINLDKFVFDFNEYKLGIKVYDENLNKIIKLNKVIDLISNENYYCLGIIKIKE